MARLSALADDGDATVRLGVATAARQLVSGSLTVDSDLKGADTGGILVALVQSSASGKDPLLPFMIWMAAEPGFAARPQGALEWLANDGGANMPLAGILARKAMRRLCDLQDRPKLDLVVDFLKRAVQSSEPLTIAAIEGLIEAQRAKPLLPSVDTIPLFEKLRSLRNPPSSQWPPSSIRNALSTG